MDIIKNAATTLGNKVASVVSNTGLAKSLNAAAAAFAPMPAALQGKNAASSNAATQAGDSKLPNILHQYASYNYNFTLSVLDDNSLNFPDSTYRIGKLGPIILKSGSGDPDNRISTVYKYPQNPQGIYDFFLEDVKINQVIGFNEGTGNTNAIGIDLKIVEPYSMGLFFQVLQSVALEAGHTNYLEAPLLLTIEFKGHIDPENQNITANIATKHIPLKLMVLGMRVSGKGSEYDVKAYPVNEKAFSSMHNELKTDISIKGKSVAEMLQTGEKSLQTVLNKALISAATNSGTKVPDQILISFPDPKLGGGSINTYNSISEFTSATVNPKASAKENVINKLKLETSALNGTLVQSANTINELGLADMGFTLYEKGDSPFAKDNLTYDSSTGIYVRGNVAINPAESEFRFAQGGDIVNAINQVLLMSNYGRYALQNISPDGFVKWWRIETHMYYITSDANLTRTGVKPKLINFRVIPYDVDSSNALTTNTRRPGTDADKQQVLKEYNYIYSGKNIDVLDFDIEFKAGFFTAMSADAGKNNKDVATSQNTGAAANSTADRKVESTGTVQTPDGSGKIAMGQVPVQTANSSIKSVSSSQGGGGTDDSSTLAAKQFHTAITSGVDMIALDLTILGDPYYMGDSGMGNYAAEPGPNRYVNKDGAMNWDNSEIHVNINFRTPVDINLNTGMYEFTTTNNVPQFSGLYRVIRAESMFSRGKFTQVLKMFRMKNQDSQGPDGVLATSPVPVPKTASQMVAEQDVLVIYGTNENSQQTALLAAQEAGPR